MKLNPKILFSLTIGLLVSSFAKAQYAQNKKAYASQIFTLRLTKPAGTQVDLTATANKLMSEVKNSTTTLSQTQSGSDQNTSSGLTVTGVTTGSKETQTNNSGSAFFVPIATNETVQIITLSKA